MNFMKLATLLLACTVILGAFGAHTLAAYLEPAQLKSWHTAVEYQFYHSLGLLFISIIPKAHIANARRLKLAGIFLLLGMLLFSGSIYVLSTRSISGISASFLGPITPIGGLCFVAGWILCFFSLRNKAAE